MSIKKMKKKKIDLIHNNNNNFLLKNFLSYISNIYIYIFIYI